MQIAEPLLASWKAELDLRFERREARTVLAAKRFDGPLAFQKPLYPEGGEVCHGIVLHPPAGVAGGDELAIGATVGEDAHALLTTPGAGKWYRSAGPRAEQRLRLRVEGGLEWLPQETIVFDGAVAGLSCEIELGPSGRYVGWEVLCLGRSGSGERFENGRIDLCTSVSRSGKLLWREQGSIDPRGRFMRSPVGLAGHAVCATLVAAAPGLDSAALAACRAAGAVATLLPGVLVARWLGDSSEAAKQHFIRLWQVLRPALFGRPAVEPRIWRT